MGHIRININDSNKINDAVREMDNFNIIEVTDAHPMEKYGLDGEIVSYFILKVPTGYIYNFSDESAVFVPR